MAFRGVEKGMTSSACLYSSSESLYEARAVEELTCWVLEGKGTWSVLVDLAGACATGVTC